MAAIDLTLTEEENVLALLVERNPTIGPYVNGLTLGSVFTPSGGTTQNSGITVTANVGSGLQEGSAKDYYYTRPDLADDATLGTFAGSLYVTEGTTQEQIQDQLALEAGLLRSSILFSAYTPIDDVTPANGTITVTPVAGSLVYIGTLDVSLVRYVPAVEDVAPDSELTGFTSPEA